MSSDQRLADLETIPVDEYFKHEEYEFTPWLANNIDKLET